MKTGAMSHAGTAGLHPSTRGPEKVAGAKYAVDGVTDEQLTASPYWRGEWVALGEGRDSTRYWPLSRKPWLLMDMGKQADRFRLGCAPSEPNAWTGS